MFAKIRRSLRIFGRRPSSSTSSQGSGLGAAGQSGQSAAPESRARANESTPLLTPTKRWTCGAPVGYTRLGALWWAPLVASVVLILTVAFTTIYSILPMTHTPWWGAATTGAAIPQVSDTFVDMPDFIIAKAGFGLAVAFAFAAWVALAMACAASRRRDGWKSKSYGAGEGGVLEMISISLAGVALLGVIGVAVFDIKHFFREHVISAVCAFTGGGVHTAFHTLAAPVPPAWMILRNSVCMFYFIAGSVDLIGYFVWPYVFHGWVIGGSEYVYIVALAAFMCSWTVEPLPQ
mmetsp:Transcript_26631/g.87315  ORF Transcript_26631/g.87315 Transcript_26631/m.87315 type:complete len:291 (+) Transcript_26631:152-1024(+)